MRSTSAGVRSGAGESEKVRKATKHGARSCVRGCAAIRASASPCSHSHLLRGWGKRSKPARARPPRPQLRLA
eukprot:3511736-Pleurochrysis_carterae.AAC.3